LCWNHGRIMANSKIRMDNSSVSSMLLICSWQLIEHSNISVYCCSRQCLPKRGSIMKVGELATVVAKIL
jgi:hypothetical protein